MHCFALRDSPEPILSVVLPIATARAFVGLFLKTTNNNADRASNLQGDNDKLWPSASLYEKVRKRVIRSVRASPDDVEDAYHEAILSVVSSACRDKPPATPANVEDYLTTATRNKLIDAIRQRASASRKHDRFAADFAALQRHDQDTTESQAINIERIACFQLFFDCLSGRVNSNVDEDVCRLFSKVQKYLASRLTDKHWVVLRAHGLHDAGFETCAKLIRSSTGTAYNRWKEAIGHVRDAFVLNGVDFDGSPR